MHDCQAERGLRSRPPIIVEKNRTRVVDMPLLERTEHAAYCPHEGECACYSIHLVFYSDRVDSIDERRH